MQDFEKLAHKTLGSLSMQEITAIRKCAEIE